MKIKKWSLVVIMILLVAVAGTIGLTAYATTAETAIPEKDVIVDYEKETITVFTDKDELVYFTETYHKDVSRWSVCEVREVEVKETAADGTVTKRKANAAVFDISWVVDNKTVRIYLCGDVNKKVINADITWEENFGVEFFGTLLTTDITEAETWKKVYEKYPNFSEDTGYFIFTTEKNGREMSYFPDESLDTIQWRKGSDGVWREYSELDLKEMNIRGINLEFRVVADNVGGAKASSTAKASVSKLGSAPVVLVNPDIMTVGIKNGMEFSFDKENWILVPEYSKKFGAENYLVTEAERKDAIETIYTKERLAALMMQEIFKTKIAGFKTNTAMNRANLEAILGNNVTFEDKGVVLYVREISTDRKAASKISEVYIPYAPEDTANANPDDIKFSYGDSKTNSGGIVIENKSKYKYQVGVIAPDSTEYSKIGTAEEDDLDLSGIKWTSVKGGKMMKISNKKVPKGSYLVYRIAGEDGNLPSTYKIYGPMKYDHVTYAGIGTATYAAGQTLTAVPSTNFKGDEKGNYRDEYNNNLSIQWQGSLDKLAKDEDWKNLSTNTSLELTNDMKDMYIRVIISDVHGNKKYSDPVGPVKYVEPPKDDNKGDQNATPTPDGKQ